LTNCAVRGNFVVGGHGGNASGNQASGPGGVGSGGGIYNVNSLVLSACTLDANSTTYGSGGTGGLGESIPGAASGGGLANPTGNATLYTSTIANNIVNGNGSTGGGGGIFSQGTLVIYNATISGNSGDASGGGVNGNGQIRDTLIAGNTAFASPDVAGAFTTAGYNLIGAIDGSSGFANGVNHDQAGTQASPLNPLLGSLASNGGLTPTMALLTGSPAIDKGNRFGLVTDQRGQLRPYDFAGIGNAAGGDGSDIGAFELNLPILNVARSANQVVLSWPVSDTGYTLQFKTNLTLSIAWSNVLGAPILIGSKHFMTNSGASGNKFYRLAK
ncbi:MAG: Hemolysin-type calcium-binding region, partial [Verrucomicrobiales bacterium]|nr:Hemolysin-type calcium-binding region [Verrucomicrobiales bacterium]